MKYQKKKPQNPRGWNYDARRFFEVRDFYRKQLKKFEKLGIGKRTENGVEVTQSLMDITRKRYLEVCKSTLRYTKRYQDSVKDYDKKYSMKEVA